MKLIGICGKKQSGKDTVGGILATYGYRPIAFAAPLKIMLKSLYEYIKLDSVTIDRMLNGDLKEMPVPELHGHSTRYALQTLGVNWGREYINKDLWLNIAIEAAKQYDKAVITDVRFPNEAEAIQEAGGNVIRILRYKSDSVVDNHESEAVDNILPDYYLDNNGDLRHLQQELKDILHA